MVLGTFSINAQDLKLSTIKYAYVEDQDGFQHMMWSLHITNDDSTWAIYDHVIDQSINILPEYSYLGIEFDGLSTYNFVSVYYALGCIVYVNADGKISAVQRTNVEETVKFFRK